MMAPGTDTKPNSMRIWYFLLIFLVSIIYLGHILWPFWSILVLSFLLTNLFRPLYKLMATKMPEKLASILTCLLIILIVFIPLLFFVGALSNEALGLYHWGRNTQVGMKLQLFIQDSPMVAQFSDLSGRFWIRVQARSGYGNNFLSCQNGRPSFSTIRPAPGPPISCSFCFSFL